MNRELRFRVILLLATWVLAISLVRAATPETEALAAAQAWGRAIMAHDVDAQMKLLPQAMYPKPDERERQRQVRLHETELARINNRKYVSFDVRPPAQTMNIGTRIVVVVPYRSIQTIVEGRLQTDSVLIALSEEGSNQWSVFDGTGRTVRTLTAVIPGYTKELRVPPAVTKVLRAE